MHAVHAGSIASGEHSANSSAIVQATQPKVLEVDSPLGHYGITGMRERVAALGGRLTITALDGTCGTVVEALVPIAPITHIKG